MTTTATAQPKAKFSSRNLSAVFKAPLRTKPLPDNATGPLQRPSNHMVVLGRAAVAAPAPLNTPSLKRESQVHDMHVSLVPAGSNWAEQAEAPKDAEPTTAPAEVAVSTAPPEKVWTSESVAEHLHTDSAAARPKATVGSCGRWGDDAVEQDIVQNDIRRQRQKEREFPDLKEAVEETKMHHDRGHALAVDRSPSMGPQQPEQHHGRATGRWAHFTEQEETHRPMHEDQWSRDRYGRGDEDRWSRDRYSRFDDGYGRERRPYYESSRGDSAISPVPDDSRTHFSRSDARFDIVASGDRDRVLSHSPHRMDWGSGRLGQRDGRSSSPIPLNGPEGARFHAPQPTRSLTHSPAPASSSPAPMTPPLTADAAPARAMNWRNVTSTDQGRDRAWGTPRRAANEDDEPHTPVVEEVVSSTESSSHSSVTSSPSPTQQVQLLKRPKMLFDPKTGGMVSAEDAAAAGKRQANGRNGNEGRDRETANASAASESIAPRPGSVAEASRASADRSSERVDTKVSKNVQGVETAASVRPDTASTRTVIAINTVEVATEETASASRTSLSSAAHTVDGEGREAKKMAKVVARRSSSGSKRAEAAADPRTPKPKRESRSKGSRANTGQNTDRNKCGASARNDRRSGRAAQAHTNASGREVREVKTQKMKVNSEEVVALKQIAEGSSGGVVVITDEQEGIEVSPQVDGFETVKPRRVVLSEKKQLRQRLASAEAAAPAARASEFAEGKKSARADAQSKGEEVHENVGLVAKGEVDAPRLSKPRGNARKPRDNNAEQAAKDRKPRPASKQQPKQSARGAGQKSKKTAKATGPDRSNVPSAETAQPAAKPTEQVAGEAPAESPVSKKRSQYVKVSQPETKREQRPKKETRRISNERKAPSNAAERKPEPIKRQRADRAVVEKAPAAKARPKQVRQVYVVKTPAPAPASVTSTAA
ncbi:hypothetical protein PF010_g23159 [Phytophthora fragariae]|uniref:BAT2 N-terminal domain-containing protein n=3 Tax=Phytophthora fragariae TaxID=53985 RepID=A0A6A3IJ49_9STRA|nr:hypothetical protein PF011_g22554 [Phytophthora fragariae]KAE9078348.1 hypothetical protein PF010_g23159 [Phytophthora fragariae]KAE9189412.1 hypothetical protein PF004_g22222 [Phytophthora fragariae]